MALAFKRSRNDTAHERTFPNAKATVIFRNDVSNKNLLKNPFRTQSEPVGPAGVQNRPVRITTDNRGNVFATSIVEMNTGVSNKNLLHNPYRFRTDPDDDPRTLTLKVIKDINASTTPKYIRENRGIDEIAFIILQHLQDNGVKLVTISLLKSYMTGVRLNSILDQGGQHVTRAFDVFNQLINTSKKLYITGQLDIKMPSLLLGYSQSLKSIFGDVILQDVTPMVMIAAVQDLNSVSTVLSKLVNAQNSISPSTNLNINSWVVDEQKRLEENARNPMHPLTDNEKRDREELGQFGKIRTEIQRENNLDPWGEKTDWRPTQTSIVPQQTLTASAATGSNEPTGTQNIRDADNVKQEGAGKRKRVGYIGGSVGMNNSGFIPLKDIPQQSNSGIIISNPNPIKTELTNPINVNLTNPIGITLPSKIGVSLKDPIIVNTNKPLDINIKNEPTSTMDTVAKIASIIGGVAGAAGIVLAGRQAYQAEQHLKQDRIERADQRRQDLLEEKEKDLRDRVFTITNPLLIKQKLKGYPPFPGRYDQLLDRTLNDKNTDPDIRFNEYMRELGTIKDEFDAELLKIKLSYLNQYQDVPQPIVDRADITWGFGKKSIKSKKTKTKTSRTKKSSNLDAQILQLLKG